MGKKFLRVRRAGFLHEEINVELWVWGYFHTIVVVDFCLHLQWNGVSFWSWCIALNIQMQSGKASA